MSRFLSLCWFGHCSSSWQAMVGYGNRKPVFGQWMVVVVVLGSRLAPYLLIRRPTKSYQWMVTHSLDSGLLNELRKFQTTMCRERKRGLCFSTTDRPVTGKWQPLVIVGGSNKLFLWAISSHSNLLRYSPKIGEGHHTTHPSYNHL